MEWRIGSFEALVGSRANEKVFLPAVLLLYCDARLILHALI
jgi:hypothetical protein